jgi:hypothetical protein
MLEHDGKLFFTGCSFCAGEYDCVDVVYWDGVGFNPFGTQTYPETYQSAATFDDAIYIGSSWSGTGTTLFRVDSISGEPQGPITFIGQVATRGEISAMIAYGGELVLAGAFNASSYPYISTMNICTWDGTDFDSLGSGLGIFGNTVKALEVYNGDLIAGGYFLTAGGQPANCIARWDGSSWSPLGAGVDALVYDMAVFNNELYVCGFFKNAGGAPARNIARWNGAAWNPVGTGVADVPLKMITCDNQVVVGGSFKEAGGSAVRFIAGWDGASWNNVGGGVDSVVADLVCYNGELVVASFRTGDNYESFRYYARWDGISWDEPLDFSAPACCQLAGDANLSGAVNIGDVTFIIQYMFTNGDPPECCESADSNGDGTLNIGDVTHLIGQMFLGGPDPICGPQGMHCGEGP